MRRKSNLKLPNGFGSVVYLGGNRRKPYGARVTTGWNDDGTQIRQYVGYGETYNDGYQILCKFHNTPFNIQYKDTTVGGVYFLLEPIMYEQIGQPGMSDSNYKNLTSAYKNYLNDLGKKKIIEVQKNEIQKIINNSGLKHTGRGYIKNIWERLVTYANEDLGLKIDTDVYNLKLGEKEKSDKHKVIDYSKIPLIENLANKGNETAMLIMIYLFTGWRPSELLKIENPNVFLEEDYMLGGIKTEAGKNRPMPIHSKIKPYVEYFYNPNNKYLITSKITGKKITYDNYQNMFDNLMVELGLDYVPGDTRKTFATRCSELEIPDVIIKRLMGHSLSKDVTNNIYIEMKIERLKNMIERIYY